MPWVYVIRTNSNNLYTGHTSQLKKRLSQHKSGEGADFIREKGYKRLVFKKYFPTLLESRKFEKKVKLLDRHQTEKFIRKRKTFSNTAKKFWKD